MTANSLKCYAQLTNERLGITSEHMNNTQHERTNCKYTTTTQNSEHIQFLQVRPTRNMSGTFWKPEHIHCNC